MVIQLTTVAEVKRVGKLNQLEYTDAEIASEINDASRLIFHRYGNPMKRTYISVDDDFATYDFTGDDNPVGSVTKVILSGVLDIGGLSTGSNITNDPNVTLDLTMGNVTFTAGFLASNQGHRVTFEWFPDVYELLAKYQAAINLVGITQRNAGEESTSTFVSDLVEKRNMVQNSLKPRTASFSKRKKTKVQQDPGIWIEQDRFVKPLV